MSLDESFDRFIKYCKYNQLSNRTMKAYTDCFYQFVRIMDLEDLEEINKEVLIAYQEKLLHNGLMNSTINNNLTAIGVFLKWLKENGRLPALPSVKPLKVKEKHQPMFTELEVRKLTTFKQEYKKNFVDYRNYVACCTLALTGCRVSSLLNVRVQDVDLENSLLTFNTMKNQKPHIIPMDWELSKILKKYISICNFTDVDYVIPSAYGNRMERSALRQALVKYCNSLNIEHKGHHAFRRYFITMKVKEGIDVFSIAKYVGHSNSKMIEDVYYQYNIEHMKSVVVNKKGGRRERITLQ
jgi:integrase/recombinase XerD